MGLAVVRSLDAPRRLDTTEEREDFEQELVDQFLLAAVGAGAGTVLVNRLVIFEFARSLGRPAWTAQRHDADAFLARQRTERSAASTAASQGRFRHVTRDHLVGMLRRDGKAFEACRQALVGGARFWVTERTQPASTLVDTYARRARHTQQRAIPTLGFAQAVDDLRSRGDDLVRIGAVDSDTPPYHFQLFLNEDATAIVACLGVDQSWNPRRHSGPTATETVGPVHDKSPPRDSQAAPTDRPPTARAHTAGRTPPDEPRREP